VSPTEPAPSTANTRAALPSPAAESPMRQRRGEMPTLPAKAAPGMRFSFE
jgi:hypothetical protein